MTDDGNAITVTPLIGPYSREWVMMCGSRILKDGQPVTKFWTNDDEAARIIISLFANIQQYENEVRARYK